MTNIVLRVDREEDLRLLLELINRLDIAIVQTTQQQSVITPTDRQLMVDYILSYQNERPSFGDAAEWQQVERAERELPWQV